MNNKEYVMIKSIYKAEPTYFVYPECGQCIVYIQVQGKNYHGIALLAPEDKDFFSEKVGLNIALSRARINALKDLVKQNRNTANIRYQMYQEAIHYGQKSPEEVDPTGEFLISITKAQNRKNQAKVALKTEKIKLDNYLKDQNDMVRKIKRIRDKAKTE